MGYVLDDLELLRRGETVPKDLVEQMAAIYCGFIELGWIPSAETGCLEAYPGTSALVVRSAFSGIEPIVKIAEEIGNNTRHNESRGYDVANISGGEIKLVTPTGSQVSGIHAKAVGTSARAAVIFHRYHDLGEGYEASGSAHTDIGANEHTLLFRSGGWTDVSSAGFKDPGGSLDIYQRQQQFDEMRSCGQVVRLCMGPQDFCLFDGYNQPHQGGGNGSISFVSNFV